LGGFWWYRDDEPSLRLSNIWLQLSIIHKSSLFWTDAFHQEHADWLCKKLRDGHCIFKDHVGRCLSLCTDFNQGTYINLDDSFKTGLLSRSVEI
jgi:hypothetical protein